MAGAARVQQFEAAADLVVLPVLMRDADRFLVEVGAERVGHAGLQRSQRENAGAGADVEYALRALAFQLVGQRLDAALGGAVMAGAEGGASLDPDRDAAAFKAGEFMPAGDNER